MRNKLHSITRCKYAVVLSAPLKPFYYYFVIDHFFERGTCYWIAQAKLRTSNPKGRYHRSSFPPTIRRRRTDQKHTHTHTQSASQPLALQHHNKHSSLHSSCVPHCFCRCPNEASAYPLNWWARPTLGISTQRRVSLPCQCWFAVNLMHACVATHNKQNRHVSNY